MPVERRGQVTHVRMESTGNRRNSLSWRKPAGFLLGWHEPDELRGSCPDLWGTRGEIPRVYPAIRSRHVWVREMSANDPLTKRRNRSMTTPKPGSPPCPGMSVEATYLLSMRGPAFRRHDSYLGFRTELENRVGDAKGKGASG